MMKASTALWLVAIATVSSLSARLGWAVGRIGGRRAVVEEALSRPGVRTDRDGVELEARLLGLSEENIVLRVSVANTGTHPVALPALYPSDLGRHFVSRDGWCLIPDGDGWTVGYMTPHALRRDPYDKRGRFYWDRPIFILEPGSRLESEVNVIEGLLLAVGGDEDRLREALSRGISIRLYLPGSMLLGEQQLFSNPVLLATEAIEESSGPTEADP